MQQTEQISWQRGAFGKLSGLRHDQVCFWHQAKMWAHRLKRSGLASPAQVQALIPRYCCCYQETRVKATNRDLPQDVTCAGYWEDIAVCHRLQISTPLSLSVRLKITRGNKALQRLISTAHLQVLCSYNCRGCVNTADHTLTLIISFTIKKLMALNHPFHIWHFHKGLLYLKA